MVEKLVYVKRRSDDGCTVHRATCRAIAEPVRVTSYPIDPFQAEENLSSMWDWRPCKMCNPLMRRLKSE